MFSIFKPKKKSETDHLSNDVIDRTVLRRCADMVSILGSDGNQNKSITRLTTAIEQSKSMSCDRTRQAYERWVPHYIGKAERYKEMNRRHKEMRRDADSVPHHSPTQMEDRSMSIVKSLTDQANIANDYNDRNLARLCMTSADEIEKLRSLLDGRDKFIVDCGMWSKFVAQLDPTPKEQDHD